MIARVLKAGDLIGSIFGYAASVARSGWYIVDDADGEYVSGGHGPGVPFSGAGPFASQEAAEEAIRLLGGQPHIACGGPPYWTQELASEYRRIRDGHPADPSPLIREAS